MSLAFLATDAGKAVLSGVYLGVGDKLMKDVDLFTLDSAMRVGVQAGASFVAVGLNDAYIAPALGSSSQLESYVLDPVLTGALYVLGDKVLKYDKSGSMVYRFLLSAGAQALSSYTVDPISKLFA